MKIKKFMAIAMASALLTACADKEGSVTIQLPSDYNSDVVVVSHMTIDNIFKATKQEDLQVTYDTLKVENGRAEMRLDPSGPSDYFIEPPEMSAMTPEFYAAPGDRLSVTIKSFEPLDFEVKGSQLMEDITAVTAITRPIKQEYLKLVSGDQEVTEAQAKAIMDRYDNAIKKFVADNPKSPAIPYVILDLSGDDFKKIYDSMTPEAKSSILMPYAEAYNKDVEEMIADRNAEQARQAEVASGKMTAPDFTLPDLSGKKVSLSEFRGKWVVLDFWGSWCGWCVKGFPALKEAYKQYGDKIVIIGIDCNESQEEWRAGVKQHDLPWLQLYNGNDRALYEAYNIEGFPTKAIINPEGKLVDLTTGEDPSFFTRLANFVK